jgi:hypothetical protein
MSLYKQSVSTDEQSVDVNQTDLLLQLEQGYDPSHLVFFLWQKSHANLAVRRLAVGSRNNDFRGVS